ncbi:hypothetical protein CEXT_713111 [Caerostris extrusa]|uniref:Uncharacterized protein n=1 Tax=Caerostris extrusa TaxID=172846 RepID=A0AAV4PYS5_CAEEX|nr:hypothetical protein CEXT_713111 [Caerostris extrusa]
MEYLKSPDFSDVKQYDCECHFEIQKNEMPAKMEKLCSLHKAHLLSTSTAVKEKIQSQIKKLICVLLKRREELLDEVDIETAVEIDGFHSDIKYLPEISNLKIMKEDFLSANLHPVEIQFDADIEDLCARLESFGDLRLVQNPQLMPSFLKAIKKSKSETFSAEKKCNCQYLIPYLPVDSDESDTIHDFEMINLADDQKNCSKEDVLMDEKENVDEMVAGICRKETDCQLAFYKFCRNDYLKDINKPEEINFWLYQHPDPVASTDLHLNQSKNEKGSESVKKGQNPDVLLSAAFKKYFFDSKMEDWLALNNKSASKDFPCKDVFLKEMYFNTDIKEWLASS